MGALPKRKISRHRKGRRRADHKAKLPNLASCAECGKPKLSHVLCSDCGSYRSK